MEARVRISFFLGADAPLHRWTTFHLSIVCQWVLVLLCLSAVVDTAVVDTALVNTGIQILLRPCFQFFWGISSVQFSRSVVFNSFGPHE